ncbi:PYRG1 synthase, partial [Polypterus senegalus]
MHSTCEALCRPGSIEEQGERELQHPSKVSYKHTMKYILVTGGVISGIGKGIIASSVGTILKSCGLHVTSIKIDPYINIDAGTFSPYEHGEVFVLDDGGEVDLDLGNYERFLDIRLTKDNNLTTGKIYQYVINKERKGDYLGKTVQVVPHITDAIQEWVMRQAKIPVDDDELEPQVCLGGTVGDIESMPFIEAFRQFQFKVRKENFCNIHVSLVPQPSATGEQKTKPTQNSVRELRGLGLSPDLVVCRCSTPLDTSVKEKISMFCHVQPEQVICVHDVSSIYRVPLLLEEQGVVTYFCNRLDLPMESRPRKMLAKWKEMSDRSDRLLENCSIALVGKYTKFSDSYASVIKALEHSALAINHKLQIKLTLSQTLCKKNQSATMRPGRSFAVLRKLYGDVDHVDERHRHRFEVNPDLKQHFEDRGFRFVGQDIEGERMEIIELDDHPYFVGVQYHPEFTSRPMKPSPPYFGLLLAAAGKLNSYLQRGCRLSPSCSFPKLRAILSADYLLSAATQASKKLSASVLEKAESLRVSVDRLAIDGILDKDRRNFLCNPPAGDQFEFDFKQFAPVAMLMLQEDTLLNQMRFRLVPSLVKEEVFWRNYFYRVSLIKQAAELSSLVNDQKGAKIRDSQQSIGEKVPPAALPSNTDNIPEWERELQRELEEFEVVGNEDDGEKLGSDSWEQEIEELLKV